MATSQGSQVRRPVLRGIQALLLVLLHEIGELGQHLAAHPPGHVEPPALVVRLLRGLDGLVDVLLPADGDRGYFFACACGRFKFRLVRVLGIGWVG